MAGRGAPIERTIRLADEIHSAGRAAGAAGFAILRHELETANTVHVDLEGTRLTPSLADECFGQLIAAIGPDAFRERINLTGLSDSERPLLRHVLARRAGEYTNDEPTPG